MKGLLLKDLYMVTKYCRSYLLIGIVFLTLSLFSTENLFLMFYPCLLCGMIPVNLLAYDERSRWLQYSEAMPYTRGQIVSGKYLIGLGAQTAILLVTGIAQAIRMRVDGSFHLSSFCILLLLLVTISLFAPSISLPFIFKLGVEKGRMAYYLMIGLVCAGSILSSNFFINKASAEIKLNGTPVILCLCSIALYALSWYLSVLFYRKREL